jgi:hypothetical protein
MKAILNRDIIITGLQPWDIEIGSNCKNIALEFSKHNRVLYINAPLDFITAYKERHNPKVKKRLDIIKGKEDGLLKIKDNLWNFYPGQHLLPLNQLKNNTLFDILNKITITDLPVRLKRQSINLVLKIIFCLTIVTCFGVSI